MTAPVEPELLIARAREGVEGARGMLLERYRGYLELIAGVEISRRLRGKVDPGDIVQETLLDAHRGLSNFVGEAEAQFTLWLRKILAARIADCMRRFLGTAARNVRLEQELEVELDQSSQRLDRGLTSPQSTPSRVAARREQAVLLADALAKLPEDYRRVLVLRHFEELTFAEVARRMGRSVDSVEKLWARALARLRRVYDGGQP